MNILEIGLLLILLGVLWRTIKVFEAIEEIHRIVRSAGTMYFMLPPQEAEDDDTFN